MNVIFRKKQSGFTLIELLVVISIIGILASTVLASLEDARLSAQYTTAKQELKVISDALIIATGPGESLGLFTGNYCSDCNCKVSYGAPSDVRNISTSHLCYQNWINVINRSSDKSLKIDENLDRDPWGSPYMLDENELELLADQCRNDTLRTVGVDGQYGSADDYVILLPFRTAQCN